MPLNWSVVGADVTKDANAKDGSYSCAVTSTQAYGGVRQTIDFGTTIAAGCVLTAEAWVRSSNGSANIDFNLFPQGGMSGADAICDTKSPWKKVTMDLQLTAPTHEVTIEVAATSANETFSFDKVSLVGQP